MASDTKALPFLMLDDPLQSMDDVNALGFSGGLKQWAQQPQRAAVMVSSIRVFVEDVHSAREQPRPAGVA